MPFGWFAPKAGDGVPHDAKFVILIGNAGPDMFRKFARERNPAVDWNAIVYLGNLTRGPSWTAMCASSPPAPGGILTCVYAVKMSARSARDLPRAEHEQ